MIRLNALLYEIILHNAKVVAEQVPREAVEAIVLTLAHSLETWRQNLPAELQYSGHNVKNWADRGLGPTFITMHINYNHAGQLLFYHYLHSCQDAYSQSPRTTTADTFAQRCKQHATGLCDLIREASQRPETVVSYPLAGHILCLASTIQIHILLFGIDDAEISAAKKRLENNFEIITLIHGYWPIAQISLGRLRAFHNACLQSKDDSFRLDRWMLRFMLEFTRSVEERDTDLAHGTGQTGPFDGLRNLLDL